MMAARTLLLRCDASVPRLEPASADFSRSMAKPCVRVCVFEYMCVRACMHVCSGERDITEMSLALKL